DLVVGPIVALVVEALGIEGQWARLVQHHRNRVRASGVLIGARRGYDAHRLERLRDLPRCKLRGGQRTLLDLLGGDRVVLDVFAMDEADSSGRPAESDEEGEARNGDGGDL